MGSMLPPRWLPQKSLPPYAYLPGKNPHPVRDPAGHSYHVEPIPVAAEVSLSTDAFLRHRRFPIPEDDGCKLIWPKDGDAKILPVWRGLGSRQHGDVPSRKLASLAANLRAR